jgi:hypothetical protein
MIFAISDVWYVFTGSPPICNYDTAKQKSGGLMEGYIVPYLNSNFYCPYASIDWSILGLLLEKHRISVT